MFLVDHKGEVIARFNSKKPFSKEIEPAIKKALTEKGQATAK